MNKKNILIILFIMKINLLFGQIRKEDIYQKWVVYNTVDSSKTGWNVFLDNYILDFTNDKTFKIKTIGNDDIETVGYFFNKTNGTIVDSKGNHLYKILELDIENLILFIDDDERVKTYLFPLKKQSININLEQANSILQQEQWILDDYNIQFTNTKYRLGDEIETNYRIFIEKDNMSNETYQGLWILDNYDGLLLLELYSEKIGYRIIYQILDLSKTLITAVSRERDGKPLLLEMKR